MPRQPLWINLFLWFQTLKKGSKPPTTEQKNTAKFCSSNCSLIFWTHCRTKNPAKLNLSPNKLANQNFLAQLHSRNTWKANSTPWLHKPQFVSLITFLFQIFSCVGKILLQTLQTKFFGGILALHTLLQNIFEHTSNVSLRRWSSFVGCPLYNQSIDDTHF